MQIDKVVEGIGKNLVRKERKLDRLIERKALMYNKHNGKEERFTYHGGFDYGYIVG